MRIGIIKRTPGIAISMDVYANNLMQSLSSLYPDIEFVELTPNPWWKGEQKSWKAGSGIKKYYERYYNHPKNVSRIEADIFHILDHTDAHLANTLRKTNKKVVVTCHDLVQFVYPDILRDQARWPAFSLKAWEYSVRGMLKADHIISVSNNTKQDISKYLSIHRNQITTVPNAVNTNFSVEAPEKVDAFRSRHCRTLDEVCLLNVGSAHSRKNMLMVLNVLNQLKKDGLAVRLWRTGGNFTPQQEEYIQFNNLAEDILDFGIIDDEQLVLIYNSSDILLAPSLYEGFGLTILEAMACGLPVITSNCSSLPEVAGDAAILIEPNNIDNIINAVKMLINRKDLYKELIDKGIMRAKQFSWQHTANQVYEIYQNVLLGN